MKVGDLYAALRLDSDQFKTGLSGLRGSVDSAAASIKQGLLQGIGIGAGLSVVNLVKNAVHGVVDALKGMVTGAQEDEAAIAKLTTTLRSNIPAWDGTTVAIDERIKVAQRLAFADNETRESIGKLVAATKSESEALRLNLIAMDLARARNIDLGAASDIVAKVYAGNTGILARYGIIVDKGSTSTEALAAIQRMAAGQAETYANTSAGAWESANEVMGDVGERLGALLLPLLKDLATIVRDQVAPAIEGIFDWIATHKEAVLAALIALGVVIAGSILPSTLAWAVATLAATWPLIAIAAIVAGIVVLFGDALKPALDLVAGALGILGQVVQAVANILSSAFNAALSMIGGALSMLLEPIRAVMDLAAQIPSPFQQAAIDIRNSIDGVQDNLESWGDTTTQAAAVTVRETGRAADASEAAAIRMNTASTGMAAVVDQTAGDVARALAQSSRHGGQRLEELAAAAEAAAEDVSVALTTDLAGALRDGTDVVKNAMKDLTWAIRNPMALTRELAEIEGAATSQKMRDGLASGNPMIRRIAQEQMDLLMGRWEELTGHAPTWGANIMNAWANGSLSVFADFRRELAEKLNGIRTMLSGQSPPREGPLKDIDKGAANIGRAWRLAFLGEIAQTSVGLSSALPSGLSSSVALTSGSPLGIGGGMPGMGGGGPAVGTQNIYGTMPDDVERQTTRALRRHALHWHLEGGTL